MILNLESAGRAIDGAISRLVYDLTSRPLPPDEEIHRAIAKYRGAREGTIALTQDLTQTQADFFPADRVWSIGQIVQHLLLTEELYRPVMRNLIELAAGGRKNHLALSFNEIDNSIAFIPRELIPKLALPLNVVNLLMPRSVREAIFRTPLIPAMNPTASRPDPGQPIAVLRARTASSLDATEEIFRRVLPPNLMSVTMSHPLLGVNNVAGIFGILTAHEDRHHAQIRSVLDNPRFPSREVRSVFQPAGVPISAADLWSSGIPAAVTLHSQYKVLDETPREDH
jgi:hypothetical protein